MARGYGEKEKTGYSVEVNACYETSDAVRIQTTLLGPAKGEKTKEKKTYPYVVMKTEYRAVSYTHLVNDLVKSRADGITIAAGIVTVKHIEYNRLMLPFFIITLHHCQFI